MIFLFRSVKYTWQVFLNVKPYVNVFKICKNVSNIRLMCNVETQNAIRILDGSDNLISSSQKRIGELVYFQNVIGKNPKYVDLQNTNELVKANQNTNNKLVKFLRNAVKNKVSLQNASDNFELSDLSNFEDDAYSLYDFIEIFSILPPYCEQYSKNLNFEFQKLKHIFEDKMKPLKKSKDLIGPILTLLNLVKDVKFKQNVCFQLLVFLYNKYKSLTIVQLVEYFYLLNYFRLFHMKETKYMFEVHTANLLQEMNMDEVAVLCLAFFKAQIHPAWDLPVAVAKRVLEDIESLNDIQAGATFKFLRYSSQREIKPYLVKIYNKVTPILDKFSLLTAIHIVNSGVSTSTESEELFQALWAKANREFNDLRLKDIERILLVSLCSNFALSEDSDFIKRCFEKFANDKQELLSYPNSFFHLLQFLIMHNIYNEDLIKYAFSSEFHSLLKKRHVNVPLKELFFTIASVELERPDIPLPALLENQKKQIAMKTNHNFTKDTSSMKCNRRIIDVLGEIYYPDAVAFLKPLLQYDTLHPILCINAKNEPQKIGNKLSSKQYTPILAPKDGNLWLIFVLLRWQACLEDKVTPNLITKAKLRQYRVAGYIPIKGHNFILNAMSKEQLQEFLVKAIKDEIQNLQN